MNGISVTIAGKEMTLSIEKFPDRKHPSICVQEGSTTSIVASVVTPSRARIFKAFLRHLGQLSRLK